MVDFSPLIYNVNPMESKRCFRNVYAHFKKYLVPNTRLLLAASGGPDSTALLYLLLEMQKHFSFSLSLAYVDHGWREESVEELKFLEQFDLPIHTTRLSLDKEAPNSEEMARKERYVFFSSLQDHFDVLVLGHHKGDLAETVMKRFFEGASLPKLYGMQGSDTLHEMVIWRPMLSLTKNEILEYLNNRPYCIDATNSDTRFLRARMRGHLIPAIEKHFGKNIANPLARLSQESAELERYLERQTAKYWDAFINGELDLSRLQPIEPVELTFFIKQLAAQHGEIPSKETLDTIVKMIEKGISGKRVQVGDLVLTYERQKLKTNLFSYDRMEAYAFAEKNQ